MHKAKVSGIAMVFMLLIAAHVSASQKIVTFDPSLKLADRVSGIESLGGKVIKDLHIIHALAAVFPDGIKDASIYSLKGVRIVEEC